MALSSRRVTSARVPGIVGDGQHDRVEQGVGLGSRGCAPGTPSRAAASFSVSAPLRTSRRIDAVGHGVDPLSSRVRRRAAAAPVCDRGPPAARRRSPSSQASNSVLRTATSAESTAARRRRHCARRPERRTAGSRALTRRLPSRRTGRGAGVEIDGAAEQRRKLGQGRGPAELRGRRAQPIAGARSSANPASSSRSSGSAGAGGRW